MPLPRLLSSPHALKALFCGSALAFFITAAPPAWLFCPFLRLSGLPCPLCGMTRALCAIGHGGLSAALRLHALSPLVFALFVWGLVSGLAGRAAAFPAFSQARVFHCLLLLFGLYGAWRILAPVLG
ncbi:MAG: DUF2752 domain-containing protein [Candidatus Solibacter usitatus]|nr:DUF2752 domain-containing protein [Candidatus Solibacter usitatus]